MMNKALLILCICSTTLVQDGIIRIGAFSYTTKKSNVFLKDESYDCIWFSLYAPNGEHQAGVMLEARRNDTLFVSGMYKVEASKFIVTNYYHHRHRHEPDSSQKMFVQNARGKLNLVSFVEYTGGVSKIIR